MLLPDRLVTAGKPACGWREPQLERAPATCPLEGTKGAVDSVRRLGGGEGTVPTTAAGARRGLASGALDGVTVSRRRRVLRRSAVGVRGLPGYGVTLAATVAGTAATAGAIYHALHFAHNDATAPYCAARWTSQPL